MFSEIDVTRYVDRQTRVIVSLNLSINMSRALNIVVQGLLDGRESGEDLFTSNFPVTLDALNHFRHLGNGLLQETYPNVMIYSFHYSTITEVNNRYVSWGPIACLQGLAELV